MFGPDFLLKGLAIIVPLVLSLAVHEWAHAWSAWKLGDDTAALQGRLTLNPLAHADPIGTFLLPLLGIPFGWARPVPVNPNRFRRDVNMRTGMAITAAAGPIANVVLAVLAAVAFGMFARFAPEWLAEGKGVAELLAMMLQLNVTLALFNMIPVPPLDGSRIADGFMPMRFRPAWESVTRFAPFLLVGVFVFGGRLIAAPSAFVFDLLGRIIYAIGA